ncbi:g9434 [Coccomyxa elongata]
MPIGVHFYGTLQHCLFKQLLNQDFVTDKNSSEAIANEQVLLKSLCTPDQLGDIIYDSLSLNQSYAVAEAVYQALKDSTPPYCGIPPCDSAPRQEFQRRVINIGAATASAMQSSWHHTQAVNAAAQEKANGLAPAPVPSAPAGPIMTSARYPRAPVQIHAPDVFYSVAAGLLNYASGICDAYWRCHALDCNTPEEVLEKRASGCCGTLHPLLNAIHKPLAVAKSEYLLARSLSPSMAASDPYNIGLLLTCLWYEQDTVKSAPSGCNLNATVPLPSVAGG